jgi:NADPH:quinone reductase-like Zn-dependent oxidoreductase
VKAVLFHRYGGSDVLEYTEIDRPTPAAGQVLVKVAATSFNPVDAGIRGGYLKDAFAIDFPHVPGIDVAGWVDGDPVIGFLPMNANGAAAEFVVAPAEVLTAAPHSVPLADAAALPAVGLTAWQALFEIADLQRGQTILINGAGGAVGGYAVQLAAQAGAVVTATGSARSADRLHGSGVDRVVGYLDYAQPIEGRYDVVLNLVSTSPEETAALAEAVVDGGYLIGTMTAGPEGRIRSTRMFARSDAAQLAELVRRVDAGTLRIDVADRRPLADTAAIHDASDANRLRGKTILIPAASER